MTRIHVVQKVNQLLTSAISTGFSDIHFEPFEDVFRARYRIDGVLKDVEHLPGSNKVNQVSYVYGSNRESANQITTHSNYIYDDNGSVLSSSKPNKNLLMDYDIRSNLVSSIAVNNQYIIDYDYDASGERVYSGMGNSAKIYINSITSNPLTIIDSNDNVTHYIYGPKGIVAQLNESLTYFLHKDHLRFTRVVMNENNQAISSYDYDAWGNPMNSTVSEESTYRYTGREYDEETGLHNFRARLYDSTLMRFYQVDPAEQFASSYVYCGNNPIGLVDPDGKVVKLQGSQETRELLLSYMNKSSSALQFSMNSRGILSASVIGTNPLSQVDTQLLNIIKYSPNLNVNMINSDDGVLPNGKNIMAGATYGNRSDWWPFNKIDRSAKAYIHKPSADAYQQVGGYDHGNVMFHEILEAYVKMLRKDLWGNPEMLQQEAHDTVDNWEGNPLRPTVEEYELTSDISYFGIRWLQIRYYFIMNGKEASWETMRLKTVDDNQEQEEVGVRDDWQHNDQ